jgi:hypothetical protein
MNVSFSLLVPDPGINYYAGNYQKNCTARETFDTITISSRFYDKQQYAQRGVHFCTPQTWGI